MKKFLQGIIFISFIIPILDALLSLFNQYIKYLATSIAVDTYKLEQQIKTEEDDEVKEAIGFRIDSVDVEEEDEYDDDEGED